MTFLTRLHTPFRSRLSERGPQSRFALLKLCALPFAFTVTIFKVMADISGQTRKTEEETKAFQTRH